jgi:asparagine synthase (glutamine-hydrolysing)
MCGICGVFSASGEAVDDRLVVRMRDTMTHRGPDDAGLWCRESRRDVILGHRRLAIVDLSADGRGPMANEDGSVVVTFNGEIYNHEALRRDLEARGHRFRSRCDGEVLVHLYEEHGQAMVSKLVGMFAFGLWDERGQRLLLARDRLGIKPLYWLDRDGVVAFASELKALLPMLPRRELDPVALRHYLTFVTVPPPRTLFEGVKKLAPASTMVVDRTGVQPPHRWWDPIADRARLDASDTDWADEVRTRLERSVQRRMMSDVPVGVFLSGGVDSSTNVALMSRLTDEPVNTFSIGFRGFDEGNEFTWARRVAQQFDTRHHETVIDVDDALNVLPRLVHHQDEPIADPVCIPLYYVSKLAKEHGVTVVHVGEGSDEIFAGYPTYVRAHGLETGPWRTLRRLPQPVRQGVAAVGDALLAARPDLHIHREALHRSSQFDGRLWWGGAVAFYERELSRITTPALATQTDGEGPRDVVATIASDAAAAGARDELDQLIYLDLRLRLPELLLMRVDKLTMASAVEARVPFLDHQLVELAMDMPASEKIRNGEGKHVLKRAVSDLLPNDLVWRPKQGFSTPVADWLRADAGEAFRRRVANSRIHELGYLDRGAIDRLFALHRSGRSDRSLQLWSLVNLAVWFDEWIAGSHAQAA